MDSIAGDFPDLASRVKIGHSFEGRPMYVLKVRPMFFEGPNYTGSWVLVPETQLSGLCQGQLFRTSLALGRRVRLEDIYQASNLVRQAVSYLCILIPDFH